MRWILKALAKKVMSGMPLGRQVDYLLKFKVTRSVPFNDTEFCGRVSIAARHWGTFKTNSPTKMTSETHFFEFGAGWDLVIPLTYYILGVGRQTVVDVSKNIRLELVNDSIQKFVRLRKDVSRILNREVKLDTAPIRNNRDLLHRYGITYLAPYHARNCLLPSGAFDFISNTSTIEHIPESDLYDVLKDCRRLLKPDGIMSCHIDLRDHYSYFDRRISHYNFLKFSEPAWRLANSPLHFQNRLRSGDYEEIVRKVGFEIVGKEEGLPDHEDIKMLEMIKISEIFNGECDLRKLGIKDLHLSLRRSS
jgi:SAM-dependent methyltransferase